MFANIISQGIFQIILLTVIIFYGDVIFGVPSDRELDHFVWNANVGYHFTIFFNIFVFMQVCNSINARKLKQDEYWVFSGVFSNGLYLMIQTIIIVGQMLIVNFGGRALRVQQLTVKQHLQCLGFGATTLIVGFLVKLLPFDFREDNERVDENGNPIKPKKTKPLHTRTRH